MKALCILILGTLALASCSSPFSSQPDAFDQALASIMGARAAAFQSNAGGAR